MVLADLHARLAPSFPPYAQKDLSTAVRYLAQALQCATPQQCTPEHYNRPLPTLYTQLETYLSAQGKSPHTVRNTKNLMSRLFRLAEAHNLFAPPAPTLTPRYNLREHTAHRPHYNAANGTYLLYPDWPTNLQDAFRAFTTWATAPVVPGRPVQYRKRLTTVKGYQRRFEAYFGYLTHIEHRASVSLRISSILSSLPSTLIGM